MTMVVESIKDVCVDDEFMIEPKSHLTDDELWELVEKDERVCKRESVLKNREKFLIKVRKYLQSIEKSEGFECSDFPCRITGVTTIEPKQEIVDLMSYRPEGYKYLKMLAQDAIKVYNTQHGTRYGFPHVNDVNTFLTMDDCIYYLTFTASYFKEHYQRYRSTFEAKVRGKLTDRKVVFCRLKLNALSEVPD